MNRFHQHPLLATLVVSALAAGLTVAALPPAPIAEAMPHDAAPWSAEATGSNYPAPQIDESAPIPEPAATF
jgi:hypothetical protein